MRIAVLAALLVLGLSGTASAQAPYNDPKTPAGWAWAQIQQDQVADFNKRCGKVLNTRDDAGWDDPCRQVPARFIVDALTDPQLRDRIGRYGLRLRGVEIKGTIDLAQAEITPQVWLEGSRVTGGLFLDDTHWKRLLFLDDTTILGGLSGWRMNTDNSLMVRNNSEIKGPVSLGRARIHGDLDMKGASFSGDIDLDSAAITGALFINGNAHFGKQVVLRNATLDDLEMGSSFFADNVNLNLLKANRIFMDQGAIFSKNVSALDAKIDYVFMDDATFEGIVTLQSTVISGDMLASGAKFDNRVDLSLIKVHKVLDLSNVSAPSIDLSGADAGELRITGLGWWCPGRKALSDANVPKQSADLRAAHWALGDPAWRAVRCNGAAAPNLKLLNMHVADVQDSPDAWPPVLELEGFRYDLIGGIGGSGRNDMRKRSPEEWTDLLSRDPTFSTQPYTQLSSILAAAGRRNTSEEVEYAGRERERSQASSWGSWLWLSFLSAVTGYGIGLYTFRVVWWVLALTILGAVILQLSPLARTRGWVWSSGASLHRLLPVIELSKEFTDFFDNLPQQAGIPRMAHRFQQVYFAVHAVAGYTLSFFLIAAMSGITQKV